MRSHILLVLAVAAAVAANSPDNSGGFSQVWQVRLPDKSAAAALRRLEEAAVVRQVKEGVVGGLASIAVTGENAAAVAAVMRRSGLEWDVKVADFAAATHAEMEGILGRREAFETIKADWLAGIAFDLDNYHTYEEIMDYLQELASEYPDLVSTEVIGHSFEGRDMRVLRICSGGCGGKPAVWLDGGIHAREWISPAAVLYVIDTIVQGLPVEDNALLQLDWHFLPVLNPDGYQYTWDSDRLWRKTRHVFPDSTCIGTDGNRNFGYHWDEIGASDFQCADTYHGPTPFSEVELQALYDYVMALGGNLVYYVNHHAYGQLIMYPWGYSRDETPDAAEQDRVANIGYEALNAVHGSIYDVGPHFTTIYPASGISCDWAYGDANIKYSYIVELRDNGEYGFELPPDQIRPTGEELYAFHAAVAKELVQEFL